MPKHVPNVVAITRCGYRAPTLRHTNSFIPLRLLVDKAIEPDVRTDNAYIQLDYNAKPTPEHIPKAIVFIPERALSTPAIVLFNI
jgi:hypothetical protein